MEQYDVLVIGAGPAGTVAASIVNKAGLRVKIVEKLKFPRFVIGESLLPRCMEVFQEAGFLETLEKQGYQKKFGAKFIRNGQVCDFDFAKNFTPGWTWTWQVPRSDFDNILCKEIQRMGIPLDFETEVVNIQFFDQYSLTETISVDGTINNIKARYIIDASGYGRVIPRLFNLDTPSHLPARKSIFTHIEDPSRTDFHEPNRITILLHRRNVWAWVIPFSTGITSVGFVGDPEFFDNYAGTPEEQLRALINSSPDIASRFINCKFTLPVQSLSSWSIATKKYYGQGYVLAGNVTEFLDPVFSSGVTLAAVSGQLSANLVCKQLLGQDVDWQTEYEDYLNKGISTFKSYVNAWYEGHLQDIFFARKPLFSIQKQICSVLAGYVWDQTNPYVKNHEKILVSLAKVLEGEEDNLAN